MSSPNLDGLWLLRFNRTFRGVAPTGITLRGGVIIPPRSVQVGFIFTKPLISIELRPTNAPATWQWGGALGQIISRPGARSLEVSRHQVRLNQKQLILMRPFPEYRVTFFAAPRMIYRFRIEIREYQDAPPPWLTND